MPAPLLSAAPSGRVSVLHQGLCWPPIIPDSSSRDERSIWLCCESPGFLFLKLTAALTSPFTYDTVWLPAPVMFTSSLTVDLLLELFVCWFLLGDGALSQTAELLIMCVNKAVWEVKSRWQKSLKWLFKYSVKQRLRWSGCSQQKYIYMY